MKPASAATALPRRAAHRTAVFSIGAVAAFASHTDAPAAVRATFPQANPSICPSSSQGTALPVMRILGVPLVYRLALFWQATLG
ncbi:MAG: sodium-dependent bicarbonate transport family permease [Paracoccaceae bacterium]